MVGVEIDEHGAKMEKEGPNGIMILNENSAHIWSVNQKLYYLAPFLNFQENTTFQPI